MDYCKNRKRLTCGAQGISHEMSIPCGNFIPQTHADQIRAMTGEELADLFADNDCGYCRIHDLCFAKGCQIDCEDMWLDWLRQEAMTDG